jgi:hypothetical protein
MGWSVTASSIEKSLDCIGGEKLACEKVHKRYVESPPAQPVEEK